MTELGVFVERNLAVEGDDVAVFGENQWVDLNQGGVFFHEHFVELDDYRGNLVGQFGWKVAG